jgi:hypothetical protein
MGKVSNQQIYDLLLDISRDFAGLNTSVDELLLDIRTFNQELEAGRGKVAEQRAHLAQQRALLQ